MLPRDWPTKLSIGYMSLLRRLFGSLIRYPTYTEEYIKKYIDKPGTEQDELDEYLGWRDSKLIRAVYMATYLVYSLKSLAFPFVVFIILGLTKYNNVNIEVLRDQDQATKTNQSVVYAFQCLATNCSRLASQRQPIQSADARDPSGHSSTIELARDLTRMPVMSWCFPTISRVNEPTQYLEDYGLLVMNVMGAAVLVSGVLMPAFYALHPIGNLHFAMILAPKVTRQVIIERAEFLARELLESYLNYCSCQLKQMLIRQRSSPVPLHQAKRPVGSYMKLSRTTMLMSEARSALRRRLGHSWRQVLSDGATDKDNCMVPFQSEPHRLARDCLPVVRSEWWRSRAAKSFTAALLFNYLVFTVCHVGHFIYMTDRLAEKRDYYEEVGQQMRRTNCAIWLRDTTTNRASLQLLELRNIDLGWHSMDIFWAIIQTLPIYVLIGLITCFYALNSDIYGWLCEMRFQLSVGLEVAKQILHGQHQETNQLDEKKTVHLARATSIRDQIVDQSYSTTPNDCMDRIKVTFKRLTSVFMLVVSHKSLARDQNNGRGTTSRLESSRAMEWFVAELIETEHLDMESCVELMQKLHINFRIFLDHIHHYAPTITIFILFFNLINYSIVIVCIFFSRQVADFFWAPIFLVTPVWASANFLILVASNFHAKACRAQTLVWSLIAETSQCEDIRIRHLSVLWLKQAHSAEMNGGYAFSAFSLRITYVNIIQIIIWTGTIVVVTMRV